MAFRIEPRISPNINYNPQNVRSWGTYFIGARNERIPPPDRLRSAQELKQRSRIE